MNLVTIGEQQKSKTVLDMIQFLAQQEHQSMLEAKQHAMAVQASKPR